MDDFSANLKGIKLNDATAKQLEAIHNRNLKLMKKLDKKDTKTVKANDKNGAKLAQVLAKLSKTSHDSQIPEEIFLHQLVKNLKQIKEAD